MTLNTRIYSSSMNPTYRRFNMSPSIGLGGTSLLIVVGVALETAKQLEGLMLKRRYVRFIDFPPKYLKRERR